MTLPEQIAEVPDDREARAPYNFVPLPNKVVPAEQQSPVDQSVYDPDRHTGTITCHLKTAAPLYVRCGYAPEDFAKFGDKPFHELSDDEKRRRAQFFHLKQSDQPAIPGSSLRGMLRSLVEIASYGKMDKVTDRQHYFFRAVAAKVDDPLAKPYRDLLKNVQAGYLVQRGQQWLIRPAQSIGTDTFIKVRERDIPRSVGLVRMNESGYRPQYIEVSFTHKRTPNGRTVVDEIDKPGVHPNKGQLVTSGNMLETGRAGARTPRKNHIVVLETTDKELQIDPQAVEDYRSGLTEFQKGPTDLPASDQPFSSDMGMLSRGRAVFYCEPRRGEDVHFFGHSPNFRLPYWRSDTKRAATPADLVPDYLKDEATIDIAEAIFGFVRRQKTEGLQALAGRVFVGDALLAADQQDVLLDQPLIPQILSTPKPTTFQHYLVQTEVDPVQVNTDRRGQPIYQLPLAHYQSKVPGETVVRGHKLYWHKGEHPRIGLPPEQQDTSETQKTLIRPVKPGTTFEFTIRFENLSDVELGALLWVLRVAADERYRLKLGMGKPLGMGAVQIASSVQISKRAGRYQSLFAGDNWELAEAEMIADDQKQCITAFEQHVLEKGEEKVDSLDQTLRIQCLLALLKWSGPDPEQTRYMQIEYGPRKENEYKDRPVLPLPVQVIGGTSSGSPQSNDSAKSQQPTERKLPAVGKPFTGKVLKRDDSAVVIQVPGFDENTVFAVLEVEANTPKWTPGKDSARVEVVGIRKIKDGRTVVQVRRAAKKKE